MLKYSLLKMLSRLFTFTDNKEKRLSMSDDLNQEPKQKNGFAFGLMIFGLFVILPMAFAAGVYFDMKNTHDLRLECLKQSKTYVNGMCLQFSK